MGSAVTKGACQGRKREALTGLFLVLALVQVERFLGATSEEASAPPSRVLARGSSGGGETTRPVLLAPPSRVAPSSRTDETAERAETKVVATAPAPARAWSTPVPRPRETRRSLLQEVVAAPTLEARVTALDERLGALPRDEQAALLGKLVATTPGRGDEVEAFRLEVIERLAPFTRTGPVEPRIISLLARERPRDEVMAALDALERGELPLREPVARQLAALAQGTDDPVLQGRARGLLATSGSLGGTTPSVAVEPEAGAPE